jgi:hypothetical protein
MLGRCCAPCPPKEPEPFVAGSGGGGGGGEGVGRACCVAGAVSEGDGPKAATLLGSGDGGSDGLKDARW